MLWILWKQPLLHILTFLLLIETLVPLIFELRYIHACN